ncbi:hypothetical protein D554_0359 [Bordetella holmesii 30539]|uniref:N-acetyltransferase YedL n=1 Tax=Bordetella holmesii 1058 TaxID=1247648 RepID=A0ABP3BK91_9BORD|nr:hypothetical protein D560_0867 [Bordetella holmesii ATCC 51541]EXF89161.1 hypothetical protein D554_0359 [Bordetella holmesii 30539]EXX95367.1 hypothetical protein D559_2803 [Bordetella holmesii 1058]KAK88042.1 hypothetical protein L496_2516 [Bordetella holmesii CDC-H572-BH]KCV15621.1 hypothetical protein AZ25_1612 [Bordetella holmesii 04P3421]
MKAFKTSYVQVLTAGYRLTSDDAMPTHGLRRRIHRAGCRRGVALVRRACCSVPTAYG